jgi:hypothetical protein
MPVETCKPLQRSGLTRIRRSGPQSFRAPIVEDRECAACASSARRCGTQCGAPAEVRDADRPRRTPHHTHQLLARAHKAGSSIGALCDAIHHRQAEAGLRRILGMLSLAKKYGSSACDQACATALELGVTEYRFRPPLSRAHTAGPSEPAPSRSPEASPRKD